MKVLLTGLVAFVICSGATCPPNVQMGLINLGACAAECGVGSAASTVQQLAGGAQSINGAAIGWGALDCVLACAATQGLPLIVDAIAGSTKSVEDWKSEKGIPNEEVPPTFDIVVTPHK